MLVLEVVEDFDGEALAWRFGGCVGEEGGYGAGFEVGHGCFLRYQVRY